MPPTPSTEHSPTERFSSRVGAYLKYRPHYPPEIIPLLRDRIGLLPSHVIADIGSGTGFSSELFLENGNRVYGVEPNEPMRKAGERYLAAYKNFCSIPGTAEATTLPERCIDCIVAGQAFHWFNLPMAYAEFQRILKADGWAIILWNDRQLDTTPFLRDYEALLQEFARDYNEVNHHNFDAEKLRTFFTGNMPLEVSFENTQTLDYEGLKADCSHPPTSPMLAILAANECSRGFAKSMSAMQ